MQPIFKAFDKDQMTREFTHWHSLNQCCQEVDFFFGLGLGWWFRAWNARGGCKIMPAKNPAKIGTNGENLQTEQTILFFLMHELIAHTMGIKTYIMF